MQLINIPKEEPDDNPSHDAGELTRMALPYMLQLFHAGLEGKHGVRISIQCADDGTFKGVISAVANLGQPTELGVVAFTNGESVDGILAYFEDSLTYGELKWRPDKYWAEARIAPPESPKKRVKVAKHL